MSLHPDISQLQPDRTGSSTGSGPVQSEDCLFLDVIIPTKIYYDSNNPKIPINPARLKPRQRLPVLVYITGSTFNDGGNYWIDPSPLASSGNIIIVKVQFRLGPFGWLSTLSQGSPTSNIARGDQCPNFS